MSGFKIGTVVYLVTTLFGEAASNHHVDPHGTRVERAEAATRRGLEFAQMKNYKSPAGGSGDGPDPDRVFGII